MIELSNEQIQELRKLQKLTVEENPGLKTVLEELDYIRPTDEYPWGENNYIGNYIQFIEDFNFNSYNKFLALLEEYNIKT